MRILSLLTSLVLTAFGALGSAPVVLRTIAEFLPSPRTPQLPADLVLAK